jgi:hypothetical protein
MNDQHQEGASQNGWSSRIDTTSTATAEPVDRRWFEEALRAQGFLVEPPALDDDTAWDEGLGLDSVADEAESAIDDEPLAVEADAGSDDEALVEPEAFDAAPEVVVAEAEPGDEPEPVPFDAADELIVADAVVDATVDEEPADAGFLAAES